MRGKGAQFCSHVCTDRITPAHAGKSKTLRRKKCLSRDHPRACGEKSGAASCICFHKGSPPRMRGKAAALPCGLVVSGITPAHAGKRSCSPDDVGDFGDHPRACGEKRCILQQLRVVKGSPPRMRGKAPLPSGAFSMGGITPAHAGKSFSARWPARAALDHPRACGEKSMVCPRSGPGTGSPPRMRGKARPQQLQGFRLRITPAHAGKSESGKPSTANHTGSPPRMRGKVQIKPECPDPCRITPAHAGKRKPPAFGATNRRDHPRACGEKENLIADFGHPVGSPPRMRGKG